MSRFLAVAAIALCAQLFTVAPAAAGGSKIASALGDLRWGMSEYDVRRFAKRYLTHHYEQAIKKASGKASKAKLREELDAHLAKLEKSLVQFDGAGSQWDRSSVGGEFTYGNSESMIALEDTKAEHFYFFINGELWKWVKVLPAAELGGKNFSKFVATVNKRFGGGLTKSGARLADREDEQKWVEFLDRRNRLRAVDQTEDHNSYALVFEDMDTVRDLSSLRANAPSRRPAKARKAIAQDKLPEAEPSARPAVARKKRASIFANEEGESDEAYEKRRKREQATQQAKQRREHARKQSKEKSGTALEGVSAAADSDDPLVGL